MRSHEPKGLSQTLTALLILVAAFVVARGRVRSPWGPIHFDNKRLDLADHYHWREDFFQLTSAVTLSAGESSFVNEVLTMAKTGNERRFESWD